MNLAKRLVGYDVVKSIPVVNQAAEPPKETLVERLSSVFRSWRYSITHINALNRGLNKHELSEDAAKIFAKLYTVASMSFKDTQWVASYSWYKAKFAICSGPDGVLVTASKEQESISGSYTKFINQLVLEIGTHGGQDPTSISVPYLGNPDQRASKLAGLLYPPLVKEIYLINQLHSWWRSDHDGLTCESHLAKLAASISHMVRDAEATWEDRLLRSETAPERGALPTQYPVGFTADDTDRFIHSFKIDVDIYTRHFSLRKLVDPLEALQAASKVSCPELSEFAKAQIEKLGVVYSKFSPFVVMQELKDESIFINMKPEYAQYLPELNSILSEVYAKCRTRLKESTAPLEVMALNKTLEAYLAVSPGRDQRGGANI